MFPDYPTVAEALKALRKEGHRTRLLYKQNRLHLTRSSRSYAGEQCRLLKYFRIPPHADRTHPTTIYVVELPNRRTAVVVSEPEHNAAFQLAVMMDKMNIAARTAS